MDKLTIKPFHHIHWNKDIILRFIRDPRLWTLIGAVAFLAGLILLSFWIGSKADWNFYTMPPRPYLP